jgi:hypothetical protein
MNINHIIEGWANYIKDRFDVLPEDIKLISEARLMLCNYCEIREGGSCSPSKIGKHIITGEEVNGCGCYIAAKSMALDAKCPLGKWETRTNKENNEG